MENPDIKPSRKRGGPPKPRTTPEWVKLNQEEATANEDPTVFDPIIIEDSQTKYTPIAPRNDDRLREGEDFTEVPGERQQKIVNRLVNKGVLPEKPALDVLDPDRPRTIGDTPARSTERTVKFINKHARYKK